MRLADYWQGNTSVMLSLSGNSPSLSKQGSGSSDVRLDRITTVLLLINMSSCSLLKIRQRDHPLRV